MLWVLVCVFGASCAYTWYWFIRSIIFYVENGFDFSVNFGPDMYGSDYQDGDGDLLMSPRRKFLFGWPVSVVISSLVLLSIILALIGVLKPCVDCGH